ncbi:hypothetical protein [Polaromonas sp. YR568]|uniref:AbiU2 domain-containing protein n=1 Tax=Polaromonas sp. YR568 TaxID=1855301 RepID=UPI0031383B8D
MASSKILSDIIDSAIAAKTHYEVWWAQASEARPKLVGVMNEHSDFFHASYDAHYTAFFVNVAHLFDKRPDSSSIPTYFTAIRPSTDPAVLAALESEFAALSLRAKPLVVARHKTVAHVDSQLTEKDVFEPLNITWNEVRDIIYDAAEFVAHLAAVPSGSIGIPRDRRLIEATLKLIQAVGTKDF